MSLDPTNEEKEIQDIVHELSQDIEKDRLIAKKLKKIALVSALSFVGITVLVLCGYLLYLSLSVTKLETEVKEKEKNLRELEQSLFSLMYQEQLREEYALAGDAEPDTELAKQVEENIQFLKEVSQNTKGRNILRGNESQKEIALTFDLATGEELPVLYNYIKEHKIKVTLFLSNERPSDINGSFFIRNNLDYIKRMAKTGSVEFGNHTWSHFNYQRSVTETSLKKRTVLEYLSKSVLDLPRMAEELKRVEDTFHSLTKQELKKYYRLPYGALSQLILDAHASLGYTDHIMWSNNSKGSLDLPDYISKQFLYKKTSKGKKEVVRNPHYKTGEETLTFLDNWEKADPNGMNGAIILMHLGGPRKFDKLIYILPTFIERMKEKGYKFVTLSEVLNDKKD
ncbi:polysaccharide deacetylase family protein [Leptospira noumeaensis]|uniref:Polysaccharide deacetylase family protein n=1 Tax=Leptospira noumeaensis TaxID=2484964 RepID=A0A4R9IES9_9LEPT|nr:polysaccharide deacetylase family protein [Leptospira noumeaensis]TGK86813.1 polysaccharide deacetylase family protein [Leptospira noumeaensis]